jgi:Fe-S-cluster-containing dehydrogenase component
VVETTPTLTGAMADNRLPAKLSAIRQVADALAKQLQVVSQQLEQVYDSAFVSTAANDLAAHRGASIVIAGDEQPAQVHYLAHLINGALGNIGKTIVYTAPAEANPVNQTQSLRELAQDMSAGKVEFLLMLGGNPAFDAPADFDFAQRLTKVKTRVHLGTHVNETAELCEWHIPKAHFLESWSDARAFDGTASIIQPLIEPLYGGKTAHEILAAMLDVSVSSSYGIVRAFWQKQNVWPDFEAGWQAALHDGIIPNTASPARAITAKAMQTPAVAEPANATELEIVFRADPNVYDGEFANNAWLQELPQPITRLTWDNAAQMSAKTAERLRLEDGDVIELSSKERKIRAPILRVPGHADDAITLPLGYGRKTIGRIGKNVGFDAYPLRVSDSAWLARGVQLRKTSGKHSLVTTQHHHSVEGRNIVHIATLQDFTNDSQLTQEEVKTPKHDETLYNLTEAEDKGYAWGMAIDLTTCIGCNACSMACVAENNTPVVGKEQVANGREMHWIRVDSYFSGAPENPRTVFQPVPCMHCETAPCELVCPVAATVHSHEGLNLQVYNRCIGTRYCSNNCPYKVRRFNFLEFNAGQTPVQQLMHNPNVTVRSRGVMEKCTYCVQRIEMARIESDKQNRRIRDGEIIPACAQACPTEAIIFGDIHDPNSRVNRFKKSALNYGMLAELNTRPRTTYIARITNPNPSAPV